MTTQITSKQIKAIARATKACRKDGYGNQIAVFSDGSYQEAVSSNDVVAMSIDGEWVYPICRISVPLTSTQVVARLADR